jgi:hypothetical protein
LLYSGTREGINQAVLAFEPRRSDLPLQVAFPILLANLTGELLGSSTAPTEAVAPGTPVQLVIPSGAKGLTVARPDGTVTELVPGASGGSSAAVTFAATDRLGIYTVTPIVDATASAAPSGGPSGGPSSAPASAAATARPVGSADASSEPIATDPLAPVRFAVDLFDVDESSIAPGSPGVILALASAPGASPAPGASGSGGSGSTERPTTRDELWVPIVLGILLVLCVEWALYHRDGLTKVRRSLADRLGRSRAGTVSR